MGEYSAVYWQRLTWTLKGLMSLLSQWNQPKKMQQISKEQCQSTMYSQTNAVQLSVPNAEEIIHQQLVDLKKQPAFHTERKDTSLGFAGRGIIP